MPAAKLSSSSLMMRTQCSLIVKHTGDNVNEIKESGHQDLTGLTESAKWWCEFNELLRWSFHNFIDIKIDSDENFISFQIFFVKIC